MGHPNKKFNQMDKNKLRIVISWSGLPIYASKLIKTVLDNEKFEINIISANLQVDKEISQNILNKKVHVIDSRKKIYWKDLGLEIPRIFFQAGWFYPSFNFLGSQVKSNGGNVILLIDNCWKNNIRQYLGYIKFNLLYKNKFDAFWVPGKSGRKLMNFFGVNNKYIFEGLYGSDPNIFFSDKPANERDKSFTFIGQLIERKGIDILVKAFNKFYNSNPDWKLNIYGRGYYSKKIQSSNGIQIYDFKPPAEIAEVLRKTRFLILPSKEDHWPLVVSESSLSGCGLILSDKIGNIPEFLNKDNGFIFRYNSVKDLVNKLSLASNMSNNELIKLTKVSSQLGSNYLPSHWKIKFYEIINFFVND